MKIDIGNGYFIFRDEHGLTTLCFKDSCGWYNTLARAEKPTWEEYGNELYDCCSDAFFAFKQEHSPKESVPEDVLENWNDELNISFTKISCMWDDIQSVYIADKGE